MVDEVIVFVKLLQLLITCRQMSLGHVGQDRASISGQVGSGRDRGWKRVGNFGGFASKCHGNLQSRDSNTMRIGVVISQSLVVVG